MQQKRGAIVLFSGGQDSTTCLYWAKQHFEPVIALSIAYGQRHDVELRQAALIARFVEAEHVIIPFQHIFSALGEDALTGSVPITHIQGQLPSTFVPGRNYFFLGIAAALAYHRQINDLVTGVCEADFAGYPDCRADFVISASQTLSLAMDRPFQIHTPLITLTKAQTWHLAKALGCLEVVIEHSHTCYEGSRVYRHTWGYGCGTCPACLLRAKGFAEMEKL